jgi:ammonium transporter Rh
MIFVGFGFLMVFMKSYSWSAIGFNYLIACWATEVTMLTGHFWNEVCHFYNDPDHHFGRYSIDMEELLFMAEFGSGAVLITFGALLGKTNLL